MTTSNYVSQREINMQQIADMRNGGGLTDASRPWFFHWGPWRRFYAIWPRRVWDGEKVITVSFRWIESRSGDLHPADPDGDFIYEYRLAQNDGENDAIQR